MEWGAFFERYRPLAVRFVAGLGPGAELAEDLFQEAARAIYERAARGAIVFESHAHARNYLFRTLRNLAADAARQSSRSGRASRESGTDAVIDSPDPRPGPPEQLEQQEFSLDHRRRQDELIRAIRALGQRDREALHLRYGLGLTFREMKEKTGISISTLQARVESGLTKLRKKLGKGPPGQ